MVRSRSVYFLSSCANSVFRSSISLWRRMLSSIKVFFCSSTASIFALISRFSTVSISFSRLDFIPFLLQAVAFARQLCKFTCRNAMNPGSRSVWSMWQIFHHDSKTKVVQILLARSFEIPVQITQKAGLIWSILSQCTIEDINKQHFRIFA